jgi:two-component system response regulator YesN
MPDPPPQRVRFALADDDVDFRKALATLLVALGHEVVCQASNGRELLDGCLQAQVDVVIADLDMPMVDGLEVAEFLSPRRVPVILLSGHPDAQHVNVRHEPLAARLLKPVTKERLVAAIDQALAWRRTK